MTFVLASNNEKKLREMRQILSRYGMEVISQSEAGLDLEVEETGVTFEENALLKASACAEATGLPSIADDSGLEVDALSGAPGVFSARYGGEACSSDEARTKTHDVLCFFAEVMVRQYAAKCGTSEDANQY